MFKQSLKFKKGFSVLFASLTGSLVLAIGLAILSITIKQITLASAGRESQLAFYAADTGVECALFLDSGGGNVDSGGNKICPQGIFGIPNDDSSDFTQCGLEAGQYSFNSGANKYKCIGSDFNSVPSVGRNTISVPVLQTSSETGYPVVVTNFSLRDSSDNLCFNVSVEKSRVLEGINEGNILTKIVSRGYSTCETPSRNRFERAIKIKY